MGIEFCDEIWRLIRKEISEEKKKKIAKKLYNKFFKYDMDDACGDSDIEKFLGIGQDE